MSGHSGCIRLKIRNSWWNRNVHNVQRWLTTGHSSLFFSLKNVLRCIPFAECWASCGVYRIVCRLDGLDTMLAWAMGSSTGHTAVAVRVDGELYVSESTTKDGYWPTDGIQKTPWKQWIAQAWRVVVSEGRGLWGAFNGVGEGRCMARLQQVLDGFDGAVQGYRQSGCVR